MERFSARPSGRAPDEAASTHVFVAEPGHPLPEVFARARELVARHRRVRIIAHGVSLERTWPAWARECDELTVTEWGGLHREDRAFSTRGLQDDIVRWLEENFSGAVEARALYCTVCSRFFLPVYEAFPYAKGLVEAFPEAEITFMDPRGRLADLFTQLRGAKARTGSRWAWRARLLSLGVVGVVGTVARELRAYVAARPSFARLDELRRQRPSTPPKAWFGAIPDWYRINHQLLDAFAVDAAERDAPLGVLLAGSLTPGQVSETDLGIRKGGELWPGLGALRPLLEGCVVEQAVVPERPVAFLRALAKGVTGASTALARLSKTPVARLAGLDVDLSAHAWSVVTVATSEVMRATLAQRAAADLTRRMRFEGVHVVFGAAAAVGCAAADLELQRHGAITVDHPHGAISDLICAGLWGQSTLTCAWVTADARSARFSGRTVVQTGMPLRLRRGGRTGPIRRILVMSNYAHRDQEVRGCFPNEPLQEELLDIVPRLRALVGEELQFRWRPHPADLPHVLERTRALIGLDAVTVSRGSPLAEDADWADLIVTSQSTALIEVLFIGVPVFVHTVPDLRDLPLMDYLHPARQFWRAPEGARMIARFMERDALGPDRLAPEHRALVMLFGPTGEPVPMHEFFGGRATRALPGGVSGEPDRLVQSPKSYTHDGDEVPGSDERV